MSLVGTVVNPLLDLHGVAAYSLVGGLVFAEAGILLGFVLPGETAVLIGGVLASRQSVSLPVMVVVVIGAAVAGDTLGYELGGRFGPRLFASAVFDRHREALERARDRMRTRGGRAVFFARFTAFLRAVAPGLAGATAMPYRRFAAWNAAGAVIWGAGLTLAGDAAGHSYRTVERVVGLAGQALLAVAVLGLGSWLLLRRRTRRS